MDKSEFIMKPSRKLIKLQLGKEYIVWFNYKTKYKCRFIQPTNFGFNFLNLETNKCLLKRHLYPSKYENHSSGDWFFINEQLKIEEKENQDLNENKKKR